MDALCSPVRLTLLYRMLLLTLIPCEGSTSLPIHLRAGWVRCVPTSGARNIKKVRILSRWVLCRRDLGRRQSRKQQHGLISSPREARLWTPSRQLQAPLWRGALSSRVYLRSARAARKADARRSNLALETHQCHVSKVQHEQQHCLPPLDAPRRPSTSKNRCGSARHRI